MNVQPPPRVSGGDGLSTPAAAGAPVGGPGAEPGRAEPRWLSADEQRVWRLYLESTQLLADAVDAQLQRDAGLSHADYEVLVRLSEAPERRMRMSELADRTLFSRSRLSHAVARLERAGWVRREATPEDRRGMLAHLTDAGLARLRDAAPGHVAAVRELLFDRLTAEQVARLGEIVAEVRGRLPDRGPAATG